MRGNKSFMHQANKKRDRNFDAPKLDNIQTNSGIKWFREISVYDNRFTTINHLRVPDLTAQTKSSWIILEHDSCNIHGELAFENERTLRRNKDYASTKRPYFVINQELCKTLGLDEAKLSAYLYYHTLSQINAGVW